MASKRGGLHRNSSKGRHLIEIFWSEMVCEMEATHVQNQNELWDIVSANWNRLKQRNQYWRIIDCV